MSFQGVLILKFPLREYLYIETEKHSYSDLFCSLRAALPKISPKI